MTFDRDDVATRFSKLLAASGLTLTDASQRLQNVVAEIGNRWGHSRNRPTEKAEKAAADAVATAATSGDAEALKIAADKLATIKAARAEATGDTYHHLETEAEVLRWYLESNGRDVRINKSKGECTVSVRKAK